MILKTLAIPALLLIPTTANDTITCVLTSPPNGATVSGVIQVTAQCSDNVVKVEFMRDGVVFATKYRPSHPKNFRFYRAEDFPAALSQSHIARSR